MPRVLAAGLALLALAPAAAMAAWPHDPYMGGVPVTTQFAAQNTPVAISDGAGGVIVAWQDYQAGNSDIYAQRVSAAGVPMWTANGVVVANGTSDQSGPAVTSDGLGGVIVAWIDSRSGSPRVYVQRLNSAGAPLWAANGIAITSTGNQSGLTICTDGSAGAILAWEDLRPGSLGSDIYIQHVSNLGVPQWTANGVVVCNAANDQIAPSIATDQSGGAFVAWMDVRSASYDIYAQRVFGGGAGVWTANGVAVCSMAGNQTNPVAISDGARGVIMGWIDLRSGTEDLYVQRLGINGAEYFSSNGAAVCTATGIQDGLRATSDGEGGAVFAWTDQRAGNPDVYAQRVSPGGAMLWTADGAAVCTASGGQGNVTVASDGGGGAIVAWVDTRSGSNGDLYAQRMNSFGIYLWNFNGLPVSLAGGQQTAPQAVGDGVGGAIVVWTDNRNFPVSGTDLYAQNVERMGVLGNPEPVITQVRDVPNDEGGSVKLSWSASYLDADPTDGIVDYRIWRSVPPLRLLAAGARAAARLTSDPDEAAATGRWLVAPFAAQDYAWEYVGTTPSAITPSYSMVVSTTSDSVAGSNPRTAFRIEARTGTSSISDRWFSAPDSGYSVDNRAPSAPLPLFAQYANGSTSLAWHPNAEPDLASYRLYRGATVSFATGPATLLATTTDTAYLDAAGAAWFYKLTAVDVHGNESPVATFVPTGIAGATGAAAELSLAAPMPTPARGVAVLRWTLPAAMRVRLSAYDAGGRRVRTLADGEAAAGEHTARVELADDAGRTLPPGLYLVRLEAAGRVLVRRVAVMK